MMVVLHYRSKYFGCLSNGVKFLMESPSCQEWSRSFHLATEANSECRMWTQLQLHVINFILPVCRFQGSYPQQLLHHNRK